MQTNFTSDQKQTHSKQQKKDFEEEKRIELGKTANKVSANVSSICVSKLNLIIVATCNYLSAGCASSFLLQKISFLVIA